MNNLSDDIVINLMRYIKLGQINKRIYLLENKIKNMIESSLKKKPIIISYIMEIYQESLLTINSYPIKISQKFDIYQIKSKQFLTKNIDTKIIEQEKSNKKLELKNNNLMVNYCLIKNLKSHDYRFSYFHLF